MLTQGKLDVTVSASWESEGSLSSHILSKLSFQHRFSQCAKLSLNGAPAERVHICELISTIQSACELWDRCVSAQKRSSSCSTVSSPADDSARHSPSCPWGWWWAPCSPLTPCSRCCRRPAACWWTGRWTARPASSHRPPSRSLSQPSPACVDQSAAKLQSHGRTTAS